MEIQDKVTLITGASGASGGIGLATARLFAARGARVALAARSAELLEQLAVALPEALAIPTDMRDEAAVAAMVAAVDQRYGRLDVLINNAGQGMYAAVERTSLAQYRSLFELNVVGVLAAMQAVIPLMRRTGGGLIINISSGTTKMILPGTGPYASTKHALNGLSMVARAELEPEHIGVSLVYPWITATGFQANALSVNTVTSERIQAARGDSAEYVAELIAQAVQSEAAEVYADNVLLGMARQSRG